MSDTGKPVKRVMARLDSPETKKDRRLSWIEENKDLHLPGPLIPGHVDRTGHVSQSGWNGRVSSETVVTCMVGWRQPPADGRPNILVLDHTGPTCLHALMVMSLGDVLVSKIAVHLDDFVDIVALSRVCRVSRRALSMKHPDFAAFRAALEPFGRSYSPAEWKKRASELIARHCAFALFRFLGARLPAPDRPEYATAVMNRVLVSRIGVPLTDNAKERTLAFCKNAYKWSWDMSKYGPWKKYRCRRQSAVIISNPDLALDLFKRLTEKDSDTGGLIEATKFGYFDICAVIKAAIYAGVPLPVFQAFFESVHGRALPEMAKEVAGVPLPVFQAFFESVYGRELPGMAKEVGKQAEMLSRTIFSPNPELLVYALDRVTRQSPRNMDVFIHRLVNRRKMPRDSEYATVKHFVSPAVLDILKERGIVNLKGQNGLRLVVMYQSLYREVPAVICSSAKLERCQAEIEWYETNFGAKKQQ